MPIFAIGTKIPKIHPSAFIAPTATIVGAVTIEAHASVWYGAVLRGDTSYVEVHEAPIFKTVLLCTGALICRLSSDGKPL